MYKDCLVFSFNSLGWMNNSNVYSLKGFFGLKTLEDQMEFLLPYLNVDICYDSANKKIVFTWYDVLNFAKEKWKEIGNFVLLVWFDDEYQFGHAIPVINGELLMGKQYIGEQIAIKNASSFIINYIKKNKCD